MKRPKLNLKQKSGRNKIDVDDFLKKIQQAKSAGDEFTFRIITTPSVNYYSGTIDLVIEKNFSRDSRTLSKLFHSPSSLSTV